MPAEGEGPVILAMDFASPPPWGETPGLLWKIWTEDAAAGRAGGIYAFASRAEAEAYRAMHTARVTERGATDIRGAIWAVNGPLSALTRAPL
jgi:hypothetical protein